MKESRQFDARLVVDAEELKRVKNGIEKYPGAWGHKLEKARENLGSIKLIDVYIDMAQRWMAEELNFILSGKPQNIFVAFEKLCLQAHEEFLKGADAVYMSYSGRQASTVSHWNERVSYLGDILSSSFNTLAKLRESAYKEIAKTSALLIEPTLLPELDSSDTIPPEPESIFQELTVLPEESTE